MSTSAPASILLHELATLPLPAGGSSLAVAPRVAAPALAPGHQGVSHIVTPINIFAMTIDHFHFSDNSK